ncbi:MAG TPA: GNAT family protein, partial [Gammaproteobacteria bacterium]|nr:GNAT family protein [Gammaproteobacteria bacterium]
MPTADRTDIIHTLEHRAPPWQDARQSIVGGVSAVEPRTHQLKTGASLLIREAGADDARAVLDYVEAVSGESDFLAFGPGEFELDEAAERAVLRRYAESANQLYLLGLVDSALAAALIFSAAPRPRLRHCGELGMSVRKQYWGLGIGSVMLDALIAWAQSAGGIKKVNLRVRTDNLRAIRLYERKGFAIEGTLRREMYLGGRYFDN